MPARGRTKKQGWVRSLSSLAGNSLRWAARWTRWFEGFGMAVRQDVKWGELIPQLAGGPFFGNYKVGVGAGVA